MGNIRASTAAVLFTVIALATAFREPALAQTREQGATYVSQIDRDLTIRRVAVFPVSDNVDGIYSRPIEKQLTDLVRASHRWDFAEGAPSGQLPSVVEMEENPAEVLKATQSIDADAFIVTAVSKGPNGLSIRLDLFLKKDGKLLAQELLRDHPRFELPEIRERVNDMYKRLIARLPYDGLLMSRQQNRVTINLGKSDGLMKDQVVTIIQIISVTRHPKFNFLVSSEKEILGRVKILKVDDTLSFGAVVSEKEKGAIQRYSKVSGLSQVNYPEPAALGEDPGGTSDLKARPDSAVTFGKDPIEWLPVRPPSFGQVGMKLGIGSFTESVAMGSVGTFEANSPYYPSIGVNGEIWITPNWTARAELLQGIITTGNPRPSSSPGNLSHSLSRYSMEIGYNFLLRDDFFGPKVGISGGFASYRMYVDDSTPQAFTTVNYSGMLIGLSGIFPVDEKKIWYLGGKFDLFLMASLSETPTSSGGSPNSKINEFSFFGEKKIAENLRATLALEFALYNTTFSGAGTRTGPSGAGGATASESASSLSHYHRVITGGVNYMF